MARLTVEDCLPRIPNRFELVLLAARRARQIGRGSQPMVETEDDKPTVLALREIAAGLVDEEIVEAIEQREAAAAEELELAPLAEPEPPGLGVPTDEL